MAARYGSMLPKINCKHGSAIHHQTTMDIPLQYTLRSPPDIETIIDFREDSQRVLERESTTDTTTKESASTIRTLNSSVKQDLQVDYC